MRVRNSVGRIHTGAEARSRIVGTEPDQRQGVAGWYCGQVLEECGIILQKYREACAVCEFDETEKAGVARESFAEYA